MASEPEGERDVGGVGGSAEEHEAGHEGGLLRSENEAHRTAERVADQSESRDVELGDELPHTGNLIEKRVSLVERLRRAAEPLEVGPVDSVLGGETSKDVVPTTAMSPEAVQ